MTMVLIIASILLVVLFVGTAVWRKGELPDSISAMVYDLPRRKQWAWSAWLCMVAALLFEPLISATGFLGWLTLALLAGAALTPVVNPDTRLWHNVCGIAAGVMSQACVFVACRPWLLLWTAYILVAGHLYLRPEGWLARHTEHKGVCVAEIICTASLLGALATAAMR